MKLNILQIIQAVVGVAEVTVPLFIHSPKSQQIEAVIITDINTVMQAFGTPKSS